MSESIAKKVAAVSNCGNEELDTAANAAMSHETGLAREFGAAIRPFPTSYPGGITSETLFDERTERIIRAQADRLITTGLFEQHEREDVQNELRIVLAYEMAKYDPAKDRYTFTATVMAKRGLNAAIKRGNYLRDNPRPLSLDEPINGESGETFLDIIPAENHDPADCEKLEERLEKRDRCVAEFLASLDELDGKICGMLMEGRSIRAIATLLGMTHTGIRYRLANVLAEKAASFGLDKLMEVEK